MKKALVIFDLDGTLYRAQDTAITAVKKGLSEFSLPIPSDEQIKSFIGDTMDSFCRKLAPQLSDEEITELGNSISLTERQLVWEIGKLYDGTKNMLEELKCLGYILAICSNGRTEYIDTVLRACGIFNLFDIIKGRQPGKNKAGLIGDILCEAGIRNAMVVGDTLYDIEAAHRNGLLCIGVTYGYGGCGVLSADFIANNVDELLCNILRMDIFAHITSDLEQYNFPTPYIIGVNGVDTSGKTIFARELDKYLSVRGYKTQLIHMDDFHNEYKVRIQDENEILSYINHAFNYNLLQNEILIPVKNGEAIDKELLLLDLDSDSFTNRKNYKIDNSTVIILEGVLLYRHPLDRYFDKRIFIDIDYDTVIERAKVRDVPRYGEKFLEKYRRKYIPIQEKYISEWSPREKSDYVIDNRDYIRPYVKKADKKEFAG